MKKKRAVAVHVGEKAPEHMRHSAPKKVRIETDKGWYFICDLKNAADYIEDAFRYGANALFVTKKK